MQYTQNKRNAGHCLNPQHQSQYQNHQHQPQYRPQYRQGYQPQAQLQHRQQIPIEGHNQKQKSLTPASVIRRYEFFTRHNIPQCQWATFNFDPVGHPQVLFELLVFTPQTGDGIDNNNNDGIDYGTAQFQGMGVEMDVDENEGGEPMLTAVISQRDGRIAVAHLGGGCTATIDMEGCEARWTVGKDAVMRDGDDVFKG